MNNNNEADEFKKDVVLDATMDWTYDDSVTLGNNECVASGTSKTTRDKVKAGCTFRFAVVRNFNKTQPGWDYSFDPSELNPAGNEELKIFLENVNVRVAVISSMLDKDVDEDTPLMLGPEKMQIMGFEHAYKTVLEEYLDWIIDDLS